MSRSPTPPWRARFFYGTVSPPPSPAPNDTKRFWDKIACTLPLPLPPAPAPRIPMPDNLIPSDWKSVDKRTPDPDACENCDGHGEFVYGDGGGEGGRATDTGWIEQCSACGGSGEKSPLVEAAKLAVPEIPQYEVGVTPRKGS